MSERNRRLEELITRLEKERPEIERILNRPAIIDTGRERKSLLRIPPHMDFTEKDGNTERGCGALQSGRQRISY